MEKCTRTQQVQQSERNDAWKPEATTDASCSCLDSYLLELPATSEPCSPGSKLGARGPKLRCTASTSVPRHTPSLRRSKESALRPWPCVPCHPPSIRQSHRFSLNQCVDSVDPDANACRRTVVTWYSCLWRWHRLNTHPNLNKPTSVSSHKTQRWICKPWTESCCRSLNLPRYSLLAPPALAQNPPATKPAPLLVAVPFI